MTWSFFDLTTGALTGRTFAGPVADLERNTPEGCGAIEGAHDHLCHRVDLEAGAVVPHQPPAPPDTPTTTHEWDDQIKRWLPRRTQAGVARDVRDERDARLAACDWVVTRAMESGDPVPANWVAYRRALRDLPQQAGFPRAVTWPELPAN